MVNCLTIKTFIVSGKRDSNPRPSAWEADALPTELLPPFACTKVVLIFELNKLIGYILFL